MTDTLPFTIPDRSPLYAALPYRYRRYRKLAALCRTDPAALADALPRGFQPVCDLMEVFVLDVPDAGPLGAYKEGGIVVPCRYGDVVGAHVLYEFVTTDDSLCVGREIWGYPKKLADVDWSENFDGTIDAAVSRRGHELIRMRFEPGGEAFEKPLMSPRIQVKRFPRVDGTGFDIDQVILNELSGAELHEHRLGTCAVALSGWHQDPLHDLAVLEVVGTEFTVGSFVLGAGRILENRG